MRGSLHLGSYAMCTSHPEVRQWLAESLEHVVRKVPDLGGFFCITMSENLTNCFSQGESWGKNAPQATGCPRCSRRNSWDVIGEVIQTFKNGVRRASDAVEIIVWDWGWGDALSERLIPALPRDARFLSLSEWDQPITRGGVNTTVGEYSISVVGPGPRALRNWQMARNAGIRTMAKVQFNNTWEISAVPYIPVPPLVLKHAGNLAKAGISGLMASWTCGGYPSPNLAAAREFYFEPRRAEDQVLLAVAASRYGTPAASMVVDAWKQFSRAFEEFPYGVAIYVIPTQHGPANLLRRRPTGHRASMILFPQDDLESWCGAYPADVVQKQFTKLADLWATGAGIFRRASSAVPPPKKADAEADLAVVDTCEHHFRSTANQVEFYILRQKLKAAAGKGRTDMLARMREIAANELDIARRQFIIARRNSIIGYEASNHYYYTPLDLVEKILNCRTVMDDFETELAGMNRQHG
jgi:hypothetical protein